MTKTPHEYIRVTYEYIRVTYEYIRVKYEYIREKHDYKRVLFREFCPNFYFFNFVSGRKRLESHVANHASTLFSLKLQ
jgi:hypothetical protein